jgi:PhoPQ-activated pathogenicity-related protein
LAIRALAVGERLNDFSPTLGFVSMKTVRACRLLVPVLALWLAALAIRLPAEEAAKTAPTQKAAADSPLHAYIAKPDDSFRWVKRREGSLAGVSYAELTLTSQKWKNITWCHQLFVLKPAELTSASQGLLLIAGGRWRDELAAAPRGEEPLPREATMLALAAAKLKSPIAVLLHVPQQPILDGMVEDQIIAYTFEKYLDTRDGEWPLLLPMTKSAVRAMDAVQEFCRKEWDVGVKQFTVTGASKRGWTTWLTAAVDARVTAIAPMVIDVLNMPRQMKHQMATWGKYSEQIEDYTRRRIQQRSDTPEGRALNAIVDPYSYRGSLKQPKLLLLGTNDRYWPLDALNVYWDGLVGDKYVTYVPNNGHGLKDMSRVLGGVFAVHRAAAGEIKLPKLTWDLEQKDGHLSLSVRSDRKPKAVTAWTAASATRDFRPAEWKSAATTLEDGAYRYRLSVPEKGFAALFGEAQFEEGDMPLYLSTNVRIMKAADDKSPAKSDDKRSALLGKRAGEEWSGNGLQMKFCWCPPGEFTMGSPKDEPGRYEDEKQARVTLTRGVWLGKYEVTQRQWKAVMGSEPWKEKEKSKEFVKEGDDYAATYLSWEEAAKFCEKLTESERAAGRLPKDWQYRLPTEAQWEYACRAGATTRFSFGDDVAKLADYAWFYDSAVAEKYTHRVGQKSANPWGLHDMHGNAWEWCADWYAKELPGGLDPEVTKRPSEKTLRTYDRALRGGGWYAVSDLCRSAYRGAYQPVHRYDNTGLRVALVQTGK